MIVDAHCHVWERWPYQPPPPDIDTRARAEQLLFQMDANGVERAVVICAAIADNPRNVEAAFEAAARHVGRLLVFPDLESRWQPHYGIAGALGRLDEALSRWDFRGFTVYLDDASDGSWLVSPDAGAFFARAVERRLLLSLSVVPHQMPFVVRLAVAHPGLPILLHHYGFLGPRSAATPDARELVIAGAAQPNIYVKVSGLGNVSAPDDEYPYADLRWVRDAVHDAYGAERLIWGSDYPVSSRHMTYRQTLSLVRRHSGFDEAALASVLGGTMDRSLLSGLA